MVIYTMEEMITDLWDIFQREGNIITIGYDELILKLYYKRKKAVAIRTIINKLDKLRELGVLKIKHTRHYEGGLVYSDKAVITIYKYRLRQLLPDQTITLRRDLFSYLLGR